MTLYVFPDPRDDVDATLKANADRWPAGATISAKFPAADIAYPHIQHAWDGTPSQDRQRESATIRITVWVRNGASAAIDLAALVQAVLLDSGSASVWRYLPGAGRTPGEDPDTDLPFCTFTLTAETAPSPVA